MIDIGEGGQEEGGWEVLQCSHPLSHGDDFMWTEQGENGPISATSKECGSGFGELDWQCHAFLSHGTLFFPPPIRISSPHIEGSGFDGQRGDAWKLFPPPGQRNTTRYFSADPSIQ